MITFYILYFQQTNHKTILECIFDYKLETPFQLLGKTPLTPELRPQSDGSASIIMSRTVLALI